MSAWFGSGGWLQQALQGAAPAAALLKPLVAVFTNVRCVEPDQDASDACYAGSTARTHRALCAASGGSTAWRLLAGLWQGQEAAPLCHLRRRLRSLPGMQSSRGCGRVRKAAIVVMSQDASMAHCREASGAPLPSLLRDPAAQAAIARHCRVCSAEPGTHALIIGAGLGGLLAARALLAAGVDAVTVIDRDSLSERVEDETLEQVGRIPAPGPCATGSLKVPAASRLRATACGHPGAAPLLCWDCPTPCPPLTPAPAHR